MIDELKGPGEVEAEILMTAQGHSGSFLVIEGVDDSRFWSPRVSRGDCEVVIAGGKPAVVGGIKLLDKRSFRQAVGVVDDDCDRLRQVPRSSQNIVHTDTRDLEGLLLRSSALLKVLAEYGDRGKIAYFEESGGSVQAALLKRAVPLGRVRWYSYQYGVALDFKQLGVARFLDDTTWSFDNAKLLDAVAQQCKQSSRPQLDEELSALDCADPWQVCQGHDLVDTLGIGLARVLGNRNPGRDRISAILRAGLEAYEFDALQLCLSIRDWEREHLPLHVLP